MSENSGYCDCSQSTDFPPLFLNGFIVPYSDKVKNLGMFFNNKFNLNDHAEVCNKIYGGLRGAWPHFSCTPQLTRCRKSFWTEHLVQW